MDPEHMREELPTGNKRVPVWQQVPESAQHECFQLLNGTLKHG